MLKFSFTFKDSIKQCAEEACVLIDRVHGFFQDIENAVQSVFDPAALLHAQLVAHEWLANLIQYGNFGGRTPEIDVEVFVRDGQVCYHIEDNSEGFDLDAQLAGRAPVINGMPDRGMGLLIMQACSDQLTYRRLLSGRHRLEFCISAAHAPWLPVSMVLADY